MLFNSDEWKTKINAIFKQYDEINWFFIQEFGDDSDSSIRKYLRSELHIRDSYGFPDSCDEKISVSDIFRRYSSGDKELGLGKISWRLGDYIQDLSLDQIDEQYQNSLERLEGLKEYLEHEFVENYRYNSDYHFDYGFDRENFTCPYSFAPYREDRIHIDIVLSCEISRRLMFLKDSFFRDVALNTYILAQEILKDFYKSLFYQNPKYMIHIEENSKGKSWLKNLIDTETKEIFLEKLAMTCAHKTVESQDKWLAIPGKKAGLSADLRSYLEKLRQIRNDIAHEGYIKSPRKIFADRDFSEYRRVMTTKPQEKMPKGMPVDTIGIVYDLVEELRSISVEN
jgi:hypothetical protein